VNAVSVPPLITILILMEVVLVASLPHRVPSVAAAKDKDLALSTTPVSFAVILPTQLTVSTVRITILWALSIISAIMQEMGVSAVLWQSMEAFVSVPLTSTIWAAALIVIQSPLSPTVHVVPTIFSTMLLILASIARPSLTHPSASHVNSTSSPLFAHHA
jgi:hypothetical protein